VRALLLPTGAELYAVPLESVREVVESPAVTRVPHAPTSLLGLANVRGNVVPVADTGELMDVAPTGVAAYVAVIETAAGALGLTASQAPTSAELGGELGPADHHRAAGRYEAGGDRVAVLLDTDALGPEHS
jgi:chemotaxis signal transduction protein